MPSLVEIGPVVMEERMKICKVYDNDDEDNDNKDNDDHDDGQRTSFNQKRSLKPSVQVS